MTGSENLAKRRLKESLSWIKRTGDSYNPWNLSYMLVLKDSKNVTSEKNLPVTAAVLINLYKIGQIDKEQLRIELAQWHRLEHLKWLEKFVEE
jgi:hypothetical protein